MSVCYCFLQAMVPLTSDDASSASLEDYRVWANSVQRNLSSSFTKPTNKSIQPAAASTATASSTNYKCVYIPQCSDDVLAPSLLLGATVWPRSRTQCHSLCCSLVKLLTQVCQRNRCFSTAAFVPGLSTTGVTQHPSPRYASKTMIEGIRVSINSIPIVFVVPLLSLGCYHCICIV